MAYSGNLWCFVTTVLSVDLLTMVLEVLSWRPFIDVHDSLHADRLRQWRDAQPPAGNKAAFGAFRARALTHAEFNGGGYLYGSQNRLLLT